MPRGYSPTGTPTVLRFLDQILAAYHAGDDLALAEACDAADEATHYRHRRYQREWKRARRSGGPGRPRRITDDQVAEIRRLISAGWSCQAACAQVGVPRSSAVYYLRPRRRAG